MRVAYRGGFNVPEFGHPSVDLGDAESPPPTSRSVRKGVDETGYEEMEAYRGEPWFRDPYAPATRRRTDETGREEMEAYRGEPWFRDPSVRPTRREVVETGRDEMEAYRGEPWYRDPYARANQPTYAPANQPAYAQANQSAYAPANQPTYAQANQPAYAQANQPAYAQANQSAYDQWNRAQAAIGYQREPASRPAPAAWPRAGGQRTGKNWTHARRLLAWAVVCAGAVVAVRLLMIEQPDLVAHVGDDIMNALARMLWGLLAQ